MNPPLYPGSGVARRSGCTCPIKENAWGDGIADAFQDDKPENAKRQTIGEAEFWVSPSCEIHGDESFKNQY